MASFLSHGAFVIAFGFAWAATTQEQCEGAFESFIAEYNKTYNNADARATAFDTFCESLAHVEAENLKQNDFTLAINEFADLTSDEWSGRLGFSMSAAKLWGNASHLGTDTYSGASLPGEIDWVKRGAVTDPKNQGRCMSCWAFSTTGALEGAWKIASGSLVSMSEQQLVDCSRGKNNQGCKGGNMDDAFKYVMKNHVCTEASYKYRGNQNTCSAAKCHVAIPAGKIVGYRDVAKSDENALMQAVSKQPVSVAVDSEHKSFQLYSHGILTADCGTKIDHGVLLVGYGTENKKLYWKVKNSWGSNFGEHGYIRLARGVRGGGECGILLNASYPVLNAANEVTSVVV
jgi:C1A family cysteine protease